MHIFIHNSSIWVGSEEKYNQRKDTLPKRITLKNPSKPLLKELLIHLMEEKIFNLDALYLVAKDVDNIKDYIQSQFKILYAAGGIVVKDNKPLMIFRRGKWDLPKGKMDKGETFRETAVREIEEECGIQTTIQEKICTTWHFYHHKGKNVLKQTKWYYLKPNGNTTLVPQSEEDIEEAVWCNETQVQENLKQTYDSIAFVFKKLKEKIL